MSSSVHDPYVSLEDSELIQLVSNGNHHAFTEIVRRHTSVCAAVARRTLQNQADADDVVQKVFIKLWQKPLSWESKRSTLSTWLYQVVLNACRDHYRLNKKHQSVDMLSKEEPESPDTLQQIERTQRNVNQQSLLASAMRELPQSQADAINLAVYNELPQKQVAEILGISVKAVESLLSRAKSKLKRSVTKNNLEVQGE